MVLILLIYALASCLLLLGVGVLVITSFRTTPIPKGSGSFAVSDRDAPLVRDLPFSVEDRLEIISRLERQFHNSPSKPDL